MTKLVISASIFQSQVADLLPCNRYRKSQLTYSLLKRYKLLDYFDEIIKEPTCSVSNFYHFHADEYVNEITKEKYNKVQEFDDYETQWNQLNEISEQWIESHDEEKIERRFKSRMELFKCFRTLKSDSNNNEELSGKKKRSMSDMLREDSCEPHMGSNIPLKYNLEGDCPIFSYLPMYLQVVTGATTSLVENLEPSSESESDFERLIGINWDGGRHHASKQKASGFCYINDIVLLIQNLRKKGFKKISYIDFDLHHGDGVENAFKFSSFIQTISLHLYEKGFFPGTGSLESSKTSNLVNIPLFHGLDDTDLFNLLNKIIIPLIDRHGPEVIIIQSGGDGLMGDSYNEWQLTIHGLTRCIMDIINKFTKCHCIVLGGGGYNELVMSRFNTFLTWNIVQKYSSKIKNCLIENYIDDEEDYLIPEHEFIDLYAEEHYKYWIYEQPGSTKCKTLINYNKPEYINILLKYYRLNIL